MSEELFAPPTEESSVASLRIQSSDKVTSIGLPAAPAYHVIEFELEVLSLPSASAAVGERGTQGTPEIHRKQKDRQKTGHCMVTTDHKVGRLQAVLCWWQLLSVCLLCEMACAPFPGHIAGATLRREGESAGLERPEQLCQVCVL